jgi:hypothetical protein
VSIRWDKQPERFDAGALARSIVDCLDGEWDDRYAVATSAHAAKTFSDQAQLVLVMVSPEDSDLARRFVVRIEEAPPAGGVLFNGSDVDLDRAVSCSLNREGDFLTIDVDMRELARALRDEEARDA